MKLSEKKNFVLAFNGDSITHGGRGTTMDCNHIMGHGYQEMAAAEVGRRFLGQTPRFYNKGVSGQGLFDMASRWEEEIIAVRPDAVTILIGINDSGKYGKDYPASRWEETYRSVLNRTREALPETQILLMDPFYFEVLGQNASYRDVPHPEVEPAFGLPCANMTAASAAERHAVVREMQKTVASLAKEFEALHIETEAVLEKAVREVPVQYITWDGVHPTMIGHRLLADAWLEAAEKIF